MELNFLVAVKKSGLIRIAGGKKNPAEIRAEIRAPGPFLVHVVGYVARALRLPGSRGGAKHKVIACGIVRAMQQELLHTSQIPRFMSENSLV